MAMNDTFSKYSKEDLIESFRSSLEKKEDQSRREGLFDNLYPEMLEYYLDKTYPEWRWETGLVIHRSEEEPMTIIEEMVERAETLQKLMGGGFRQSRADEVLNLYYSLPLNLQKTIEGVEVRRLFNGLIDDPRSRDLAKQLIEATMRLREVEKKRDN